MSNVADPAGDTPPASEPSQATAQHDASPSSTDDDAQPKRRGPVPLKSPQSLERLRDRVKKAARELERLRQENAALAERVRKLETQPVVDLDGTILAFDEDPDVLRDKVADFIKAIDGYLAQESQ